MSKIQYSRKPVPIRPNILITPKKHYIMPVKRPQYRKSKPLFTPTSLYKTPTTTKKQINPLILSPISSRAKIDAADAKIAKAVEEKLAAEKNHAKQQLGKKKKKKKKKLKELEDRLRAHQQTKPVNPDTLPQEHDLISHYDKFNTHNLKEIEMKEDITNLKNELKKLQKSTGQQGGKRRLRKTKRKRRYKRRKTRYRKQKKKRTKRRKRYLKRKYKSRRK